MQQLGANRSALAEVKTIKLRNTAHKVMILIDLAAENYKEELEESPSSEDISKSELLRVSCPVEESDLDCSSSDISMHWCFGHWTGRMFGR